MKKQPQDEFIDILTDKYQLLSLNENDKIRELDLGCGVGSFTAALAARYPERKIFAADVMIGRLRKLVKRNKRMNVENMTILRVEARNLISYMFPDSSLDRIHFLCPDPWPKDRHRGHRVLVSDFVSQLNRVLKADGIFHFASDDDDYYTMGCNVLRMSGLFVEENEHIEDIKDIKSDFEVRWIAEGKIVNHSAWRKLPRPAKSIGH